MLFFLTPALLAQQSVTINDQNNFFSIDSPKMGTLAHFNVTYVFQGNSNTYTTTSQINFLFNDTANVGQVDTSKFGSCSIYKSGALAPVPVNCACRQNVCSLNMSQVFQNGVYSFYFGPIRHGFSNRAVTVPISISVTAINIFPLSANCFLVYNLGPQMIAGTLVQSSEKVGQRRVIYTVNFRLLSDLPANVILRVASSLAGQATNEYSLTFGTMTLNVYGTEYQCDSSRIFQNPYTALSSDPNAQISLKIPYFTNVNYLGTSTYLLQISLHTSIDPFANITGLYPKATQPGTINIAGIQALPGITTSQSQFRFRLSGFNLYNDMQVSILIPLTVTNFVFTVTDPNESGFTSSFSNGVLTFSKNIFTDNLDFKVGSLKIPTTTTSSDFTINLINSRSQIVYSASYRFNPLPTPLAALQGSRSSLLFGANQRVTISFTSALTIQAGSYVSVFFSKKEFSSSPSQARKASGLFSFTSLQNSDYYIASFALDCSTSGTSCPAQTSFSFTFTITNAAVAVTPSASLQVSVGPTSDYQLITQSSSFNLQRLSPLQLSITVTNSAASTTATSMQVLVQVPAVPQNYLSLNPSLEIAFADNSLPSVFLGMTPPVISGTAKTDGQVTFNYVDSSMGTVKSIKIITCATGFCTGAFSVALTINTPFVPTTQFPVTVRLWADSLTGLISQDVTVLPLITTTLTATPTLTTTSNIVFASNSLVYSWVLPIPVPDSSNGRIEIALGSQWSTLPSLCSATIPNYAAACSVSNNLIQITHTQFPQGLIGQTITLTFALSNPNVVSTPALVAKVIHNSLLTILTVSAQLSVTVPAPGTCSFSRTISLLNTPSLLTFSCNFPKTPSGSRLKVQWSPGQLQVDSSSVATISTVGSTLTYQAGNNYCYISVNSLQTQSFAVTLTALNSKSTKTYTAASISVELTDANNLFALSQKSEFLIPSVVSLSLSGTLTKSSSKTFSLANLVLVVPNQLKFATSFAADFPTQLGLQEITFGQQAFVVQNKYSLADPLQLSCRLTFVIRPASSALIPLNLYDSEDRLVGTVSYPGSGVQPTTTSQFNQIRFTLSSVVAFQPSELQIQFVWPLNFNENLNLNSVKFQVQFPDRLFKYSALACQASNTLCLLSLTANLLRITFSCQMNCVQLLSSLLIKGLTNDISAPTRPIKIWFFYDNNAAFYNQKILTFDQPVPAFQTSTISYPSLKVGAVNSIIISLKAFTQLPIGSYLLITTEPADLLLKPGCAANASAAYPCSMILSQTQSLTQARVTVQQNQKSVSINLDATNRLSYFAPIKIKVQAVYNTRVFSQREFAYNQLQLHDLAVQTLMLSREASAVQELTLNFALPCQIDQNVQFNLQLPKTYFEITALSCIPTCVQLASQDQNLLSISFRQSKCQTSICPKKSLVLLVKGIKNVQNPSLDIAYSQFNIQAVTNPASSQLSSITPRSVSLSASKQGFQAGAATTISLSLRLPDGFVIPAGSRLLIRPGTMQLTDPINVKINSVTIQNIVVNSVHDPASYLSQISVNDIAPLSALLANSIQLTALNPTFATSPRLFTLLLANANSVLLAGQATLGPISPVSSGVSLTRTQTQVSKATQIIFSGAALTGIPNSFVVKFNQQFTCTACTFSAGYTSASYQTTISLAGALNPTFKTDVTIGLKILSPDQQFIAFSGSVLVTPNLTPTTGLVVAVNVPPAQTKSLNSLTLTLSPSTTGSFELQIPEYVMQPGRAIECRVNGQLKPCTFDENRRIVSGSMSNCVTLSFKYTTFRANVVNTSTIKFTVLDPWQQKTLSANFFTTPAQAAPTLTFTSDSVLASNLLQIDTPELSTDTVKYQISLPINTKSCDSSYLSFPQGSSGSKVFLVRDRINKPSMCLVNPDSNRSISFQLTRYLIINQVNYKMTIDSIPFKASTLLPLNVKVERNSIFYGLSVDLKITLSLLNTAVASPIFLFDFTNSKAVQPTSQIKCSTPSKPTVPCSFANNELIVQQVCSSSCGESEVVLVKGFSNSKVAYRLEANSGVKAWTKSGSGFIQESAAANIIPQNSIGTLKIVNLDISSLSVFTQSTLSFGLTLQSQLLPDSYLLLQLSYLTQLTLSFNGTPVKAQRLSSGSIKVTASFCASFCPKNSVILVKVTGKVSKQMSQSIRITTYDSQDQVLDDGSFPLRKPSVYKASCRILVSPPSMGNLQAIYYLFDQKLPESLLLEVNLPRVNLSGARIALQAQLPQDSLSFKVQNVDVSQPGVYEASISSSYKGNIILSGSSSYTVYSATTKDCQGDCYECSKMPSYICSKCKEEFVWNGSACTQKCSPGLYQFSKVCQQCSPACGTCFNGTATGCLSCTNEKVLVQSQCANSCPSGLTAQGGICQRKEQCGNLCSSCSLNPNFCYRCIQGYQSREGKCEGIDGYLPPLLFSYIMVVPLIILLVLIVYSVRPLSQYTRQSFLSALIFGLSIAQTFAALLLIPVSPLFLQVTAIGFVALKGALGMTLYELEVTKSIKQEEQLGTKEKIANWMINLIGAESLAIQMVIFFKRKFQDQRVVQSLQELAYKNQLLISYAWLMVARIVVIAVAGAGVSDSRISDKLLLPVLLMSVGAGLLLLEGCLGQLVLLTRLKRFFYDRLGIQDQKEDEKQQSVSMSG